MGRKQPTVGVQRPTFSKQPSAPERRDFYSDRPSWRVGRMDMVEPFGWQVADSFVARTVHTRLSNFETMTWREILLDAKKQNHFVDRNRLCPEAQRRLESLRLDDLEHVVSLRVGATERVFGFLETSVLILLWWDPAHLVCPSVQRNT